MIFLPAGRSSTSTPGSSSLVLGDRQQQAPGAAREQGGRDLGEMASRRPRTSPRSAVSRVSVSSARSFSSSRSERSRSSRCSASSARRSRSRSSSSAASGLTWPSATRRRSSRSRLTASSSSSCSSSSAGATPSGSRRRSSARSAASRADSTSSSESREAASVGGPTQVGFLGAEQAELLAGLRARGGAGVDPAAKRRLEAGSRPHRRVETGGEALGRVRQRRGALRVRRVDAWRHERDGGARPSHTLASCTLDLEDARPPQRQPHSPLPAGAGPRRRALAGARGARS